MEIGGAQRLLSEILPLTMNRGLDVSVLVFFRLHNDFERKIEDAGIEIISLDTKTKFSIKVFITLVRILNKWDIAHVHLFPALYIVSLLSFFFPSLRLVYTEHSTHNKRRNRKKLRNVERFIYGRYKRIISISTQTQDKLLKWLNIKNENSQFVIIENGVNLTDYSFYIGQENQEKKNILMVSRFSDQKDQVSLIRALEYIKTPDVYVFFAGEGPNLEKCKKMAKESDLYDRIKFLGNRSDIPKLIAESYIGVQSSIWEGFGLTAVEFMAGGKPIIASNVDGLKQVVEGAGLLFEVGDYKELACKIDILLNNKSYYKMISKRCIKRSEEYNINSMVDKYINIYESLMNCNSHD
nr:glycosyltransferase family 4 protein [Bacteroides sp. 224]